MWNESKTFFIAGRRALLYCGASGSGSECAAMEMHQSGHSRTHNIQDVHDEGCKAIVACGFVMKTTPQIHLVGGMVDVACSDQAQLLLAMLSLRVSAAGNLAEVDVHQMGHQTRHHQ